ncbi:MAG: 30S ribosomal protein S18 [Acidobacteriota bacterium]|nr:30S ribosomal protein S18 [Blastocatellia bacterium]MDW8241231.1 30S ribosomal protein S18 [Acidobacteriota bacterium]
MSNKKTTAKATTRPTMNGQAGAERTTVMAAQRVRRRRECRFCRDQIDFIDYKDTNLLMPFIPERNKIIPRRLSGVCQPHQRMLARAIKRARNMALLPISS